MFKRGVYKKFGLFVASLVFIVLVTGSVLAADVAYIYRKDFKIDQNVLNVFEEMSMDVDLINEKDLLSTNFDQYNLVFVGDENFLQVNNIPVGEIPLVVMNYYHGDKFGFTDRDGISQIGSTAPLSVKDGVDGTVDVQVYTKAFERGRVAIPYYFLDNENKADNMITIASTKPTSSGANFGDVISLVQPGKILANGIETKEEMCFFGVVRSAYWTPEARELFKQCVGFVASECQVNADCPAPFLSSEPFCLANDIFQTETAYLCIKNDLHGQCVPYDNDLFNEECQYACSTGTCIRCDQNNDCNDDNIRTEDICMNSGNITSSCQNLPIECFSNSECGTDGLIGELFCTENITVTQLYQTFTCSNPGTGASSCSSSTAPQTIETCEDICVEGACELFECESDLECDDGDINTEDNCLNPSTLESSCEHLPIECFENTDCGTDGLIGELFCTENITVTQLYQTFTCSNPGTSASVCSSDTAPQSINTCEDICVEGSCQLFTCESDLECDDEDSATEDHCINPSTLDSVCQNLPIDCFLDSDCGTDGFITEPACFEDAVLQEYETFTCSNKGTAQSSCSSAVENKTVETCEDTCVDGTCVLFTCESDVECDDSNNDTLDTCHNPGTLESSCTNELVLCNTNADCGTDSFLGELSCMENNVTDLFVTFTCVNPATPQSFCDFNIEEQSIDSCEDTCINGACQSFVCESDLECDDLNVSTQDICNSAGTLESSCQNLPIECFSNSECGTDGLIGELFCTENVTVTQLYQTFTCSNPGTGASSCSSNTTQQINETCEDICVAGSCQFFACESDLECNDTNVSTQDTCHNATTLQSFCTNELITCSTNSECGTDGLIGEPFCAEENLFQTMTNYTCSLPGTSLSSCSSQSFNETVEICAFGCESGACLFEEIQ